MFFESVFDRKHKDYLKLAGTVGLPKFMYMLSIILISPWHKVQKSTEVFLTCSFAGTVNFLGISLCVRAVVVVLVG